MSRITVHIDRIVTPAALSRRNLEYGVAEALRRRLAAPAALATLAASGDRALIDGGRAAPTAASLGSALAAAIVPGGRR